MCRKSLVGERIKLSGLRVALDLGVELSRVESFEPGAKPRQLRWGKLFYGSLNLFGGGHVKDITLIREA
jgi:hypothetical protein